MKLERFITSKEGNRYEEMDVTVREYLTIVYNLFKFDIKHNGFFSAFTALFRLIFRRKKYEVYICQQVIFLRGRK